MPEAKTQFCISRTDNNIYMRSIWEAGSWNSWQKIYPDYTSISLSRNGFIVFNNGLILQWGEVAKNEITNPNTSILINFPISFTTFTYNTFFCPVTAGGYNHYPLICCTYKLLNRVMFEISSLPSQEVDWFAIGF